MFDLVLTLLLCVATSTGAESLAEAVTPVWAGLLLAELERLLGPVRSAGRAAAAGGAGAAGAGKRCCASRSPSISMVSADKKTLPLAAREGSFGEDSLRWRGFASILECLLSVGVCLALACGRLGVDPGSCWDSLLVPGWYRWFPPTSLNP